MVKVLFLHYACCNLKGLGGIRNLMKNGCPNGSPKSSKSRHWAPMVDFIVIWSGFERMCFLMTFWFGKKSANNRSAPLADQLKTTAWFCEGSAGEAACQGRERVWVFKIEEHSV